MQSCNVMILYFSSLAIDPTASHLLQLLFEILPEISFIKVFNSHVKDQLASWACHEIGNFLVQKIVQVLPNEEMVNLSFFCKRTEPIFWLNFFSFLVLEFSWNVKACTDRVFGKTILRNFRFSGKKSCSFWVSATGNSRCKQNVLNTDWLKRWKSVICGFLLQVLMKLLDCFEPIERRPKFLGLLLSMTKYDQFYDFSEVSEDEKVRFSLS